MSSLHDLLAELSIDFGQSDMQFHGKCEMSAIAMTDRDMCLDTDLGQGNAALTRFKIDGGAKAGAVSDGKELLGIKSLSGPTH